MWEKKMGNDKKSTVEKILRGYVGEETQESEFEIVRKPKGYWENWENVEKELIKIKKGYNGKIPSSNELNRIGKSGLVSAIHKYHGGLNTVRLKMKSFVLRRDRYYWQDWENVERELNEVIEKYTLFASNCSSS